MQTQCKHKANTKKTGYTIKLRMPLEPPQCYNLYMQQWFTHQKVEYFTNQWFSLQEGGYFCNRWFTHQKIEYFTNQWFSRQNICQSTVFSSIFLLLCQSLSFLIFSTLYSLALSSQYSQYSKKIHLFIIYGGCKNQN